MSRTVKQVAFDWISQNEKKIIETDDAVWRYAELGLQEFKTSKLCSETLEQNGFRVERGVAGMPTAFVASFGQGKPVIGIMGELDALASLSQKALPRKEPLEEGAPGHGCGHNAYATSAVAAGIAVKVAAEETGIQGTVKVFGCPAEETLVGKIFMVRDGCFNGLDACIGNHTSSANGVDLDAGTAMNSFKAEFFGRASHAGASPERGRSALDAAELMNIGVNYLREHIIQEARIHYVVENGGVQPNVVPPYARSWYYVRAPLRETVEQIYGRVLKIAGAADEMAETTHKITFLTGCYPKLNNIALSKLAVRNMREVGAPNYTEEEYAFARELGKSIPREEKISGLRTSGLPNWEELIDVDINARIYDPWGDPKSSKGGSTDVSDVMWNTPTIQIRTAGFIVGAPGHSWQNAATMGMGIGHKSVIFGSKTIAGTVLDILTNPEALKEIQEEFRDSTKGFTYRSPLPADLKPPLTQFEIKARTA